MKDSPLNYMCPPNAHRDAAPTAASRQTSGERIRVGGVRRLANVRARGNGYYFLFHLLLALACASMCTSAGVPTAARQSAHIVLHILSVISALSVAVCLLCSLGIIYTHAMCRLSYVYRYPL